MQPFQLPDFSPVRPIQMSNIQNCKVINLCSSKPQKLCVCAGNGGRQITSLGLKRKGRDVVTGEALGDGSHGLEHQHAATTKPRCTWQEEGGALHAHSPPALRLLLVLPDRESGGKGVG